MPTLADVLRNYTPPTSSVLADPIKQHFRTLPQQLVANQQALDKTMSGVMKTDLLGRPNPNYYPEAMTEFSQMMPNFMGATAWHGTPHTIKGKFDISKVGTGEGAQAYGHGMYFAENPAVATEYKEAISSAKAPELFRARATQKTAQADIDQINGWLSGSSPWPNNTQGKPVSKEFLEKRLKEYTNDINWANNIVATRNEKGNLYKVDIPDEYIPNMLNWDLPINQQSAKVQEIARQLDPNLLADTPHLIVRGQPRHWTEVVDSLEDLQNPKVMKLLKKIYGEASEVMPYGDYLASKMTGEQLYRNLSNPTQWSKEAAPYAMKAGMEDAAVSAKLNELGIKGVRYKDAISRGADEGTSNFVVFDPSEVKILEQNGKPLTRKEILEQELKKIVE